jgi:broad specificity phosphatase PhoE
MTRILVIRHGATDWNRDGLVQGRTDRLLTAATRDRFRAAQLPWNWAGGNCLSSPLVRAMETARLLGLEPKPEPRLIEMAWGEWEGRNLDDLRVKLGPAMKENEAKGLDFRPPGGESPREVQERLAPLLGELRHPTILLTHKGVLRALYALATDWEMKDDPPDKLREMCAHEFETDGRGELKVKKLNIVLERPA